MTSVIVAIAALAFGAMVVGIATGLVSTTSATTDRATMSAAVDQRLAAYADALDAGTSAGTSAGTGTVCYTAGACASITGVVVSAAQRTVTLSATHGVSTLTAVRVLVGQVGSHIEGFDARGDPVWAAVSGATTFTGWR